MVSLEVWCAEIAEDAFTISVRSSCAVNYLITYSFLFITVLQVRN